MVTDKRKLIEAVPVLEVISRGLTREQCDPRELPAAVDRRWAARLLAACRTVLFASLVDDPSAHPEEYAGEEAQAKERERLVRIMERLADWGDADNAQVLAEAREEVRRSNLPPIPPDTDDLGTIYRQALAYNGYDRHGGLHKVAAIARRCRTRRERKGQWQGTLGELRCTLFFSQRAAHHTGDAPEGAEFVLVRELYQAIRTRWREAEPEPPSVLDPFRPGWLRPTGEGAVGPGASDSDREESTRGLIRGHTT